jgi:hypothetical protein
MQRDREPSEEAEVLHCSVDEVRAIWKRIERRGDAVLKEWTVSEARRMEALRRQNAEGVEGGER